jgi:hypothetical protein
MPLRRCPLSVLPGVSYLLVTLDFKSAQKKNCIFWHKNHTILWSGRQKNTRCPPPPRRGPSALPGRYFRWQFPPPRAAVLLHYLGDSSGGSSLLPRAAALLRAGTRLSSKIFPPPPRRVLLYRRNIFITSRMERSWAVEGLFLVSATRALTRGAGDGTIIWKHIVLVYGI